MSVAWDDIRFWAQVVEDGRRTVICSPELESRIKTMVATLGLTGMVEVAVSPVAPDDAVYVVDQGALAASTAQAFTRSMRERSWLR